MVPLDKGFNRVAWIVPMGALLLAAGGLVIAARKWTYGARLARERQAKAPPPAAPAAARSQDDDEYQAKLDDALDELD